MLVFMTVYTYAKPDFVAEDLAAGHDVQVPELGLLPPLKVELEQNRLEDRERLKAQANECFLPKVQHVRVDRNLKQMYERT